MCPIGNLLGDQIAVGNDHICLVEGLDCCGPKPNPFNYSPPSSNINIVTNLDRSFKEQDEAGNEVVHDSPEPKADSYSQSTYNDRERCEIESEREECQQKADGYQDIVYQPCN